MSSMRGVRGNTYVGYKMDSTILALSRLCYSRDAQEIEKSSPSISTSRRLYSMRRRLI